MAVLLFYPAFPNRHSLYDQLFRAVWHFLPMVDHLERIVFPYSGDDFQHVDVEEILSRADAYLPDDFDPAIAGCANKFSNKVEIIHESKATSAIPDLKGIVVWNTSSPSTVTKAQALAKNAGADVVLVDPERVQQETLEIVRFAYSLWSQEELSALV